MVNHIKFNKLIEFNHHDGLFDLWKIYLPEKLSWEMSRIGHKFAKQNLMNMHKTKNVLTKLCSSISIFKYKNYSKNGYVHFWHEKLTLKTETKWGGKYLLCRSIPCTPASTSPDTMDTEVKNLQCALNMECILACMAKIVCPVFSSSSKTSPSIPDEREGIVSTYYFFTISALTENPKQRPKNVVEQTF